ncbi:MAG: MBL fold metallo-hydrolase, partial [Acidimicrobiia bacterium]|nr:MBL fold metallo-hydrolase [Acidimicrobiia bacterium]
MPEISRRVFLRRIGSSTIAVVTLGLVACSSDVSGEPSTTVPASTTTAALITPASAGTAATTGQTTVPPSTGLEVERLSLGNVAAFIVARDAAAAVIDTGNPGSAGSVEVGLTALGLDWDAVGDVILTHRHGDHVGSLTDILTRAPGALGYAGALDLDRISSPTPLVGVGDGDTVFGLQIVETPGHTPGHIAVWDSIGGALFAG